MNGLAFRLARRELRGSIGRFRVFLVALTLGVAAIAAVGSIADAMRAGLADNARSIFGGDIEARATNIPIPDDLRTIMAGAGTVAELVEMRAMLRTDDTGGEESSIRRLVNLKAVDDAWPLLGAPNLDGAATITEALAIRDGLPGIVANPGVLRILDLEVGDTARLGNARVRVAARLLTEPDQRFGFAALAPRLIISREGLAMTGLDAAGALITHRTRVLLDNPARGEALFTRLLTTRENSLVRIDRHENSMGGFTEFIDRTEVFLTLVSLTALLIGGLGVSMAVRAWLGSRMPVLATLKCLGAPARLVFRIYFIQVLILAGLGIAIGVGLAMLAPVIVNRVLANIIAFPVVINIYPAPLLTATGFGLLTAIAFSLWPLGRARDVNPSQLFRTLITPPRGRPGRVYLFGIALAGFGLAVLTWLVTTNPILTGFFIGGVIVSFILLAGLAEAILAIARRLPMPRMTALRLALASMIRPGNTTGSIVVTFGLGLAVLVAITLIEHSMTRQLNTRLAEDAPAWYFIDIQPAQKDRFLEITRNAVGAHNVEIVPMVRGRIAALDGIPAENITPPEDEAWILEGDRALTWMAQPPEHNTITAGQWWPADYEGPLLVSMDDEAMHAFGLGLGDTITINVAGREMEATIANARYINWETFGINFVFILSGGEITRAPHSLMATVSTDDRALEARVDREIADALPNVSSISVREAVAAATRILELVSAAIGITAALTLVAGFAVLAGTVAANEARRVATSTILKVLGATRRVIIASYILEYAALGLFTALVAIAIGATAAWGLMTGYLNGTLSLAPGLVIAITLGGVTATIALGLLGAMRALGRRPAAVLREEAV